MGVLVLIGLIAAGPQEFQRVRIIATSDLHCRTQAATDFDAPGFPRRRLGGWGNLAALVRENRTDACLVLDCGDFAFGSVEGSASSGRAGVDFMNRCGYDLAVLGAREFGAGVENVEVLALSAAFPLLADPMLDVVLNRRVPMFRPFAVEELRGVRLAVIGLTDPDITSRNRKADTRGLLVDEPLGQCRRYLAAVRPEGPDVIIVCGHIRAGHAVQLVDSFPEISLVLFPAGDATGYGRAKLVPVGPYGHSVEVVDLLVNKSEHRVDELQSRTLNVTAGAADAAADSLVRACEVPGIDSVVCRCTAELRPGESGLAGLVSEAVRVASGADVALLPWEALESGLPEGEVTRGELFAVAPFEDRVRVAVMDDTMLHRLAAGAGSLEPFPMLAGADLFVLGDTQTWPLSGQVARVRFRTRKPQYRVATTELLLERAGLGMPGRLSEKNLTQLWLEWACAQETLAASSGPRLYRATAGLVPVSDSAAFPIGINTASAALLEKLPGIGPMTAQRIIEYRQQHGRFGSVEDLLNVSGIGPKKMDKIRPLVTVR